eukprot:COSAG06_NODE_45691_length_352_cov_22.826087_1_plen_58_part_10
MQAVQRRRQAASASWRWRWRWCSSARRERGSTELMRLGRPLRVVAAACAGRCRCHERL